MTQDQIPQRQIRSLGWLLLLVATLFVVAPILEVAVATWPPRAGDLRWRFAALGMLGQSMLFPVFGALLATVGSVLLNVRGIAVAVAGACFVAVLLLLGSDLLFLLDALQMRDRVTLAGRRTFDVAVLRTVAILTACSVVVLVLGLIAGRRRQAIPAPATPGQPESRTRPPTPKPVVMGRPRSDA